MRIVRRSVIWLFLFLVSAVVMGSTSVYAATIEFVPVTGAYAVNSTFAIQVNVNTGGQDTTSTDAVILFNNTLLSVDTVSYGSFYGTVIHTESNGSLAISGMVSSSGTVVNGTGTLATVTFKALTSGTANLTLNCTAGRTNDSNVSDNSVSPADILDCAALKVGVYTLGAGGATSAPTTAPGVPTPTAAAAAIPQAGSFDFLSIAPKIIMGILFVVVGVIPLLI